jgi:hypothetical protein
MLKFLYKQYTSPVLIILAFSGLILLGLVKLANQENNLFTYLCVSCVFVYIFLAISFSMCLMKLNIKAMYYINKNRKEAQVLEADKFTIRQWSNLLGDKFSYYEKILILKTFVDRNSIVQNGRYYHFPEEE